MHVSQNMRPVRLTCGVSGVASQIEQTFRMYSLVREMTNEVCCI